MRGDLHRLHGGRRRPALERGDALLLLLARNRGEERRE